MVRKFIMIVILRQMFNHHSVSANDLLNVCLKVVSAYEGASQRVPQNFAKKQGLWGDNSWIHSPWQSTCCLSLLNPPVLDQKLDDCSPSVFLLTRSDSMWFFLIPQIKSMLKRHCFDNTHDIKINWSKALWDISEETFLKTPLEKVLEQGREVLWRG